MTTYDPRPGAPPRPLPPLPPPVVPEIAPVPKRKGEDLTVEEMHAAGMTDVEVSAEYAERARLWQEDRARRYERMRDDARAVFRAVTGWGSVRDADAWVETCEAAREDYRSGHFLIERLGAERYLDPPLMATLWGLRQQLIEDMGADGAHELLLIDATVMAYYHQLRFQSWIGNFALSIEHEFFGQDSPTPKFNRQTNGYSLGKLEGLRVEDYLQRIGDQLVPLMDRANRMMLRNLKALRDLRQRPAPAVAIGAAQQVNIASEQRNTVHVEHHANGAEGNLLDQRPALG